MSRSPRRVLHTAASALDAVTDLCARNVDARDEVVRALGGPEALAAVERARVVLRAAADRVATPAAGGGAPDRDTRRGSDGR